VRLGLGKQAQDDVYTAAEGITRRKLEVEIQAEEDPERRQRREVRGASAGLAAVGGSHAAAAAAGHAAPAPSRRSLSFRLRQPQQAACVWAQHVCLRACVEGCQ
jgi:hypothetical protein